MKKTQKGSAKQIDDMLPEYDFDLSKAKPNRFAAKLSKHVITVVLDPDVSQVFTTPEAVNHALRTLIQAMPTPPTRKRFRKGTT